ncbi:tyrosine--tRNA ligase [Pyrobaculum aerophilum]|uniref:Tyrosine--tRNA ligase 2 n=2 Tax=Pyrobaculum aerophilum TaxID=13773 RepID=SYY2_PYRAE|nr:tyrosine--tRNA ligase [Pyrobaculum aerophilum]Q8ZW77.1 RecName: Full=Tyrosine--tRNA ligase 2; AltName: Full=Tyrosyl-tRNA synthetase 2; Short=TyrRS 2 [Pyrobaculum aerophilum str. IM2]AAL63825.1 tyrosyl-tRNA synthetase [Pyrobaculum aerophilum str. IM2]RFA92635.1 tyrosine--tRNA ligase [Pyrobaculum aerophilum]RFA99405.1 tyrosine--tRNA ligase [Pyrobaculum aerophilum]HII46647.1 tyrosine--tRNA ligase [Pyrobaculum aerophilum]
MERLLMNVEEVVTREEFLRLKGGSAYLGFEPLWPIHIGWLIWAYKLAELKEAGFDVIVLVATWHAWINDKGSIEELRAHGERVRAVLDRIGKFKYVYGDDVAKDPKYWELVVKIAKETSLARVKRATPVMGRRAEEVELDFSKLMYPLMQVADIFYLGVDVAVGGMDQRRAHMLARDVAEKLGLKKPIALHTPIITSLSGTGRMEGTHREIDEVYAMYKMSKSKPQSAILITDSEEDVRKKIWAAYCPPRETKFNPVFEIAAYLLIPYHGPLEIKGRRYEEGNALERDYREGVVTPQELKEAVASALVGLLSKLKL